MKKIFYLFSIALFFIFFTFLPDNSIVQAKSKIGTVSTYYDFGASHDKGTGIYDKKNHTYSLQYGLKIVSKSNNSITPDNLYVKKNSKTVWKSSFVCGGVTCSFQYAQATNGNLLIAYTTSERAIGQGVVDTEINIIGIDKNGKVKFKKAFYKNGELIVKFTSSSKVSLKNTYNNKTKYTYGMTSTGKFKKY